jgi:acyl-CoA reductase-like NAD-dependent aldehyde dehydrogenase
MFYNQGQICSAPSRVILEKGIKDEFVACLKKECNRYIPHNPYDISSRVGCMVSYEQYEKVQAYITYANENGFEVYQEERDPEMLPQACCISPTIIFCGAGDDRLVQEEIFGPVVVILEADSVLDAVKIANDTEYGLAGAVWTDDLNEAYYISENVHVGLMHVNSYGEDDNSAPFGGVKQSGIGKDKSIYAFDEYSDRKTIWMKFDRTEIYQ